MSMAKTVTAGSASVQGELWGVRAGDYAEIQEPTFLPLYESVLARPEIAKANSILDVGCGPGLAAQVFSRRIGHVAGADAAAPFIEIARRRVPGGDFRVAEMESLPYADGTFEATTGFNAFQYAASPVNALREARRVVKAGGVIVIAVWGLPEGAKHARAQNRVSVSQALERIRQTARQRKKEKFTALFHHVSIDHLEEAFIELKENAAPGVDGLTCRDYEQHLERNLEDLHARVHRGAYRALPSRRVYIPKPDGRQRPIAVAALEDKIVQRATTAVLSAIYEEDFLGFSYGFRPGRGTHDAMDALLVGITSTKVNWILEPSCVGEDRRA